MLRRLPVLVAAAVVGALAPVARGEDVAAPPSAPTPPPPPAAPAPDDAGPASPTGRPGLPLRYRSPEEIEAALRSIAARPPWGWPVRLERYGTSAAGRPLLALRVGRPDAPQVLVHGGLGARDAAGVAAALAFADLVAPDVTPSEGGGGPRLPPPDDRVAWIVVPAPNPDALASFLSGRPRWGGGDTDRDRDGRRGEDGPDDLDGDGEILVMRVADENGDLVDDERDPRLMRARKPGERGRWRVLGSEGTDEDGDGRVNEDGPGGVDPNRNFPCEWRPEPEQGGAGPYPLSEPETRATAQFVLAHPRIAAVQSYHNAGRMILRPPAARTDREAGFPAEDRALYDELGKRGELLLPGYRYMQIREDLYRVHGGFVEWTAHALGVPSFTNELWGLFGWGTSVVGGDLEALRWNDVALHGEGFVRWKQARHPTLGAVELGGWRRFTIRSTPVDFLPDLCVRNALFTLEHAASVPDLAVRVVARARDGGVERLRVVVENRAMLPTVTVWAARHGLLPADGVAVTGARVLAAREVEVPGAGPVAVPVVEGVARLEEGVRGTASRTLDLWLAPDARPTEVVVTSRLGGVVRAAVK